MEKITIYTDGCCKGNPGPGGWGALILGDNKKQELNGGNRQTTNNRMELTAVVQVLSNLKREYDIDLYTDSEYVKNGITKWIHSWKNNGWKGSNKKDVKNQDLWQALDGLCEKYNISWHWVKGHAGNEYNEYADKLANDGVKPFLKGN